MRYEGLCVMRGMRYERFDSNRLFHTVLVIGISFNC